MRSTLEEVTQNLGLLDKGDIMKAYKLVRKMKDGSIAPLFINARFRFPIGEWIEAEAHPTKGFAYRPGWHCCFKPVAPHLSEKGRVWIEVEIGDHVTYNRPESQGGQWVLANMLKVVKELSYEEVEDLRK